MSRLVGFLHCTVLPTAANGVRSTELRTQYTSRFILLMALASSILVRRLGFDSPLLSPGVLVAGFDSPLLSPGVLVAHQSSGGLPFLYLWGFKKAL